MLRSLLHGALTALALWAVLVLGAVLATAPPTGGDRSEGASPDSQATPAETGASPAEARSIAEIEDVQGTGRTAAERIRIVEDPLVVEHAPEAPDPVSPPTEMPRRLVLDNAPEADATAAARALETEAAPFANPQDLPLLSIVLVDDPAFDLEREALTGIDLPLTVALDPARSDAARVAAFYRAAGHEVVALADAVPVDATAQDVEVAAAALRRALPQAVAVLDRAQDGPTKDRAALSALLPALAEAGMGLLLPPGGLGTGGRTARRAGVPAVTLYRVLDAGGERAPVIARYLDRAAFEAARDGAVVVLGSATAQTVAGLRDWRAGEGAGRVAVAPLSAVLAAAGGAP